MRTVRRNKQKLKYALYIGNVNIVDVDDDGNPKYYLDSEEKKTYMSSGKKSIYGEPVDFSANITEAGGETEALEFGLSVADYQAIALYSKGAYPLVEGAIVWEDSEVEYDTDVMYYTKDFKNLIEVHSPKKVSADFSIRKISNSLNFTRAILKAITK